MDKLIIKESVNSFMFKPATDHPFHQIFLLGTANLIFDYIKLSTAQYNLLLRIKKSIISKIWPSQPLYSDSWTV